MDVSDQPIIVPETQENSAAALPVSQEAAPEKTWLQQTLRVLTYPASLVAGFMITEKELHDHAYGSLRRFGAFDDFLKTKEGGDLEGRNQRNIQTSMRRPTGMETTEKFLKISNETKTEYSAKVDGRMNHLGLGKSYANFLNKWHYNSSGGKLDAVLKGATATGIVAVVMLTMSQSKSLLDLMGIESHKDKSR